MRKINIKLLFIIGIIFSIIFLPQYVLGSEKVEITTTGINDYDYARQVLNLVNEERAKEGCAPLEFDKELCEAARIRAAELPSLFSHTRPTGTKWYTINRKANGENIALGQTTPQEVMKSWMNSTGHRENILRARYTSVGIGAYYENDIMYWVQLFSTSPATEKLESDSVKYEEVTQKIQINLEQLWIEGFSKEENSVKVGNKLLPKTIYTLCENNSINDELFYREIPSTDLIWKSSDDNIFTVDANGIVTAKKAGKAILTASIGNYSNTYNITVIEIPIENVSLNKTNINLYEGDCETLVATITPENTTIDKNVTWISSNEKVVTVDNEGNLKAISAGKAVITASTVNGKEATCEVNVSKLIYTTIPTKVVSKKNVMTFKSKTGFESILNAENFPILDVNYKVELYDTLDNTKDNKSKLGSKNTIKIKDIDGTVVAEYMMAVKGDVTGNGYSRMYDAFQILKDSLFNGNLDEIDILIRDYDGNGYVRMYDAFQFLKDSLFN